MATAIEAWRHARSDPEVGGVGMAFIGIVLGLAVLLWVIPVAIQGLYFG